MKIGAIMCATGLSLVALSAQAVPIITVVGDSLKAESRVWLNGHADSPSWTSSFSGRALNGHGSSSTTTVARADYPSGYLPVYGYGGWSEARVNELGSFISNETWLDVKCWWDCLPDVTIAARSEMEWELVFHVEDEDAYLQLGAGTWSPSSYSACSYAGCYRDFADFELYDFTAGVSVADYLTHNWSTVGLNKGHTYRLRSKVMEEGWDTDPTASPHLVADFGSASIRISSVPEPGTFILLVLALAGFALQRYPVARGVLSPRTYV